MLTFSYAMPVRPLTIASGFQEYQIIGAEDHIFAMLQNVHTRERSPGATDLMQAMESIVTVTVSADDQIVVYDHWEDGFVDGIIDPSNANYLNPPAGDTTTLIIGDRNNANGSACNFVATLNCVGSDAVDDVLKQGDTLTLNSNQGEPPACTATNPGNLPAGHSANLLGCIPIPRVASDVRFDGGDYLAGAGGPLSVVHIQDPSGSNGLIAGASEMISAQAVNAATSYSIPVGEDIYSGDGSPSNRMLGVTEPFKYVYLNLVAFEDNTNVTINSPRADSVSFSLNRGQHYSTFSGTITGPGAGSLSAPGSITINAGTRVVADKPLSGLMFTGGDGEFQTRFYTLLPDLLHGTDYITTAPGDDPNVNSDEPMNLYIFNPDSANSIAVTVTDQLGSSTVNVPANSQVDFFTATRRFPAANSTVRLTADRPFWGVSAYNHQNTLYDWGHAWLPTRFLTGAYTVSFSPDTNGTPAGDRNTVGGAPVHIASVNDNTCVTVDFNNDGTLDQITDLDTSSAGTINRLPFSGGNCSNGYLVDSLESLAVTDPTDFDNEGTRVVADKPIAISYGQHTDRASSNGSLVDYGYVVFPIDQSFLEPVLTLDKSADVGSVPTSGGIINYVINVSSANVGSLNNLSITDVLPAGINGTTDYVPNSAVITYPDLSRETGASANPIQSANNLVWNATQLNVTSLSGNQIITIQYQLQVPAGGMGVLLNEATARAELGSSVFNATDSARVIRSAVTMSKAVDVSSAQPGETITYTLNVNNPVSASGGIPESNVRIVDPVPPNTTFRSGSITTTAPLVGNFDAAQNSVVWTLASASTFRDEFSVAAYDQNNGTDSFSTNWIENNDDGSATSGDLLITGGSLSLSGVGSYIAPSGGFFGGNPGTVPGDPRRASIYREANLLAPGGSAARLSFDYSTSAGVDTTDSIVLEISNDGGASYTELRNFTGLVGAVSNSLSFDITAFMATNTRIRFRFHALYDVSDETFSVDNFQIAISDDLPANGITRTLSYQVTVNGGVPQGTVINNTATYESTQSNPFSTNTVQTGVIAPTLTTSKAVVDNTTTTHPGARVTYQILVTNTGSAPATGVTISDTLPTNATFVSGSMMFRRNADAFITLTDAADADQGAVTSTLVSFNSIALDPSATLDFRFQVRVNLGTGGQSLDNFATVNAATLSSLDTNLVSLPIIGDATISGRVFNDVNADGAFNTGDSLLPNISVVITDSNGATQTAITNASGVYSAVVPAGVTTIDVDDIDADLPANPTLTTNNDPQTVIAVSSSTLTVNAGDVGYTTAGLQITKTSDAPANNGVSAGDTLTYTLTVTNDSDVSQSGLVLTDPLPANTTFVPGSGTNAVASSVIRVNEYYISGNTFTGTSHNLTLTQDLAPNYYVIIQGSDGDGGVGTTRGPDEVSVSLTADPFGTGDLAVSGSPNVLTLTRGNSAGTGWTGVVTVVESLGDGAVDGFTLRDVQRVVHAGTSQSGSDTSATAWSDISRVLLMGGFNGAGCDTAEALTTQYPSCHVRLFPLGSNTIEWTRHTPPGDGGLDTATSTVMVVEWGSNWTIQRRRVQGDNGGEGGDATNEYATANISSVTRVNTWVWGTGHTGENGIGDSAEAVAITLGNGVNINATETTVAIGKNHGGVAMDFEVYVMSHSALAVDHRFVNFGGGTEPDGDATDLTQSLTVNEANSWRMALAYNGTQGTGSEFPLPNMSARYTGSTSVELERRTSGQPFFAWVQGIDFSAVTATGGFTPPHLPVPEVLAVGASTTVTFQVRLNNPLPAATSSIDNTAIARSEQVPAGVRASRNDNISAALLIEPNGSAFAPNDRARTIDFSHRVINNSSVIDAFSLTAVSDNGFALRLVDPATSVVLALDSNGDGIWDNITRPNTGNLAQGASRSYIIRVTVPAGRPVGSSETVKLTGTSGRNSTVTAMARDEIVVTDGSDLAQVADIRVTPDHTTIADPGNTIVFTHYVTNNTGVTNFFSLLARTTVDNPPIPETPATWPTTIHRDSNGDGAYTAGIDGIISSTINLTNGATMPVFVVVNVPANATSGTASQTHITAVSNIIDNLAGLATDTILIGGQDPVAVFDLSGGGTQVVRVGEIPRFPGTLDNLGLAADRYQFDIGASDYTVNSSSRDDLNHPTQLYIDTTGDGTPELLIAEDTNGDGTWNSITNPAIYDTDSDGNPDVMVAARGTLAYELRRPIDPAQRPFRDPVSLVVRSNANNTTQAVTATPVILMVTRAVIDKLVAYGSADGVTVSWSTSSEHGTVGFHLERMVGDVEWQRLNDQLLPGLLHSRNGGVYSYQDQNVRVGQAVTYRLVELEATGNEITYGPYHLVVALDATSAGIDLSTGASDNPVDRFERVARPLTVLQERRIAERLAAREEADLQRRVELKGPVVKISTVQQGMHRIDAADIAAVLGQNVADVQRMIAQSGYALHNRGEAVATHPASDNSALLFYAEKHETQYTGDNIYWLNQGTALRMAVTSNALPDQIGARNGFRDTAFATDNHYTLTHLFDDPDDDYWMWDIRYEAFVFPSCETTPVFCSHTPFRISTPGRDAASEVPARLTVRLHGGSETDAETDHHATVKLNGVELGVVQWDGIQPHEHVFEIAPSLLKDGENAVEVTGATSGILAQPSVFYVNDFSLEYTRFYVAHADILELDSAGLQNLTVEGFNTAQVSIFDVQEAKHPSVVLNSQIQADGAGKYNVSFRATQLPRKYLVMDLRQALKPSRMVAALQSNLTWNEHRADYLIITTTDMVEAAQILADYRTSQGMSAMVVDVETIYDEFNYGIKDVDAIWSFLHYAHTNWERGPRYVVLAGEGSIDYRNYLGLGDSLVPSLLTPTPDGLFPSDNLLADVVGNDRVGEFAIGRLPVIDAAELTGVVNKLLAYEASDGHWTRQVIVAADPPDSGGDFSANSDAIASIVPVEYGVDRLHMDEMSVSEVKNQFMAGINEGRAFLSFYGHGGLMHFGNKSLFGVTDIVTLNNGSRLPIVTAFTCLAGQFGFQGVDSVAESLLMNPNGGAAAVWSPSGLSLNHRAGDLGRNFYKATFEDGELVIGEAILRAQARYLEDEKENYLLDIYNLIGDPATIMK